MKSSRLLKIAIWALAFLFLYSVLGFVAVPAIVKKVIVMQVDTQLHRQASVQSVFFNPFTLQGRVRGLKIEDRIGPKPMLAFDEFYIKISPSSLYRRAPVLSTIRLVKPYVSVVRTEDGRYNFSDILDEAAAKAKAAPPESDTAPPKFSLNNIAMSDGTVEFDDRLEKSHHVLDALQLAVPFVSNLPVDIPIYETPHFEGKINGEPFVMNARSKPFEQDLDTTLDLSAENIDIPRYLQYVPLVADFKLASALLTAHLSVHFIRSAADAPPALHLDGTLDLANVDVTELDGKPMLKVPAVNLRIGQFDLPGDKLVLDEVRIPAPEVTVRRAANGTINLQKLATAHMKTAAGRKPAAGDAPPAAPETPAAEPPFTASLKQLVLSGASIDVTDNAAGTTPFHTRISPVDLDLTHLSYPGREPAHLNLSLANDRGTTLKCTSDFTLTPMAAKGTVALGGIKPKDYAPYWSDAVALDIDDGTIEAATSYNFRSEGAKAPPSVSLADMKLGITSLRASMRADKSEVLRIGSIEISDGTADLASRTAAIGQAFIRDGRTLVQRNADGTLNLSQLVPPAKPAKSGPETGGPESRPEKSGAESPTEKSGLESSAKSGLESSAKSGLESGSAKSATAPWNWSVKHASIERYSLQIVDKLPQPPVSTRLEPVNLSVDGLSNAAGAKAAVQLKTRLNKSGAIAASGHLSLNPLAADIHYDVRTIDIVPYRAYVEQFVNIALSSGQLSSRGTVSLLPSAPAATPHIRMKSNLTLTDFASADTATGQDLLKWKSLNFGEVAADTAPLSMAINDIALSDFYSRLILNSDGRFNLQGLMRSSGAPGSTAAKPSESKTAAASPSGTNAGAAGARITIGRISLENGRVNYEDFFIKPNFTADITDLTGSVTALTPETPGDMDLRGKVYGSAPLQIAGKINPLSPLLYLDVQANAHQIQLSPLSPYSAKYVGYGIEKGALSLKLAYKVENNKLEATNNINLDQLTFGEKVDSPSAIKLPVLLAVSLLKDKDGVIDLNVPISGTINDPQFSIGGVILHVLMNLLVKAVTSPFALLSSLAGGGSHEELSYIEFDPGRADLNNASEGRLKTLAQGLKDRPALKLDITGSADPAADPEALRRVRLERSVKAQKVNELRKGGTPPASIKEVTVSPEEYPHYLELAYRASSFPKPRNAIGMVRDLPVPDMEKLILASTDITDADLHDLAEQRAQAAQEYLVNTGGVDGARIFLVAPKSVKGESKDTESKGAESAGTESKGTESTGAESKGAESASAESKGAQSTGAESASAESKGAQSTGAESKGAESKGAESKDSKSQASNKLTRANFTLK